ncbi:IS110 family RNA-guided transposase [Sphingomonas hengshuiensis]|uniref:Transposase n=1 Tax=Sphingomonas hengshuiensis TaxID=1609977 RepID=A0A7U4J8D1_9SPHN|nr:transposase [Sphingomonas hengshuiensis]
MRNLCGVDVSKAWLDSWAAGRYQRFANTAEGVAQLLAFCREHSVELVVMEASGGVEQAAFLALWKQGQPCAIANPRAVRSFADAMGNLEKTDRIDAEMIAGYADARQLVATPPPSEDQRRLTALTARLRQVTADLSVQKQRLHSTSEPTALASLKEAIAFFNRQTKALAAEIAALITADPLWAELDKTIRSIKGLADRTVAVLLADLPELGTLSNKAIAKLAGLAPLANDSGQRNGRRRVRGGRPSVRSILYLVADVARKYDDDLASFRDRLLAQGKAKMVVRIALARKLLVRLNAKARDAREQMAHAL